MSSSSSWCCGSSGDERGHALGKLVSAGLGGRQVVDGRGVGGGQLGGGHAATASPRRSTPVS
ncbi:MULTISPECIES: hypothetical protein [Cellulosimicrobium]|uniref:hypothetical protein n=1 Tax=Cellulosimicrobium TaxID=157920 RepID=UPI00148571AF|nr:hypothetical protein [Cellulosimicrobium cellulans]